MDKEFIAAQKLRLHFLSHRFFWDLAKFCNTLPALAPPGLNILPLEGCLKVDNIVNYRRAGRVAIVSCCSLREHFNGFS